MTETSNIKSSATPSLQKQKKSMQLHRRLVVLAGSRYWGEKQAVTLIQSTGLYPDTLWISEQKIVDGLGSQCLTPAKAKKLLGATLHNVVFDAHDHFDSDLFAMISGVVAGGGVLVLLTPPLDRWPETNDNPLANRFLWRLVGKIQSDSEILLIDETDSPLSSRLPTPHSFATSLENTSLPEHPLCATQDQATAVEKIIRVVKGHRRRPLVLLSDRGRGKSTALGIAAIDLLKQGVKRIIVTAPRLVATDALFKVLKIQLPDAVLGKGVVSDGDVEIAYFPPDHLYLTPEKADLLLIDEAAAIPASLLVRLLKHYSRIVFATTVHGYEGNGRGFAVRFSQVLDQVTPGWKQFEMNHPIRWAKGDPLERFVFNALMLKTRPVDKSRLAGFESNDCEIVRLNRDLLVKDEQRLEALFGLLVIAHYQTTGNDLRRLLDDPDVAVYVALKNQHVIATALVIREGGLSSELAAAVYRGKRRLKGHLAPQSLAAHVGIESAPELICWRVMRIAVHPEAQAHGLGTGLLEKIASDASLDKVDYLAASFGVNVKLLNFWHQSGFYSVKIGTRRNASSALYSALLLKPISCAGEQMSNEARNRFSEIFPLLLADQLSEFEVEIAIVLFEGLSIELLREPDIKELREFTQTDKSFVSILPALRRFTLSFLPQSKGLQAESEVLLMRVIQQRGWSDLCKVLELSGKTAATKHFKEALSRCLKLGELH